MREETYSRIAMHGYDGTFRADVIVDDADYEQLRRWRWALTRGYASRLTVLGENGFRKGRRMLIHRQLLGLAFGDPREGDHLNGNRLDNRRANLRIVTVAENRQNQNAAGHRDGSSRYRGVCWDAARGKWMVRANHKHLGRYDDEDEAGKVAAAYRREHMPFATG